MSLAAVRQDDPLAFGLDRLRAARVTYGTQLGRLIRSLPPDRADALERSQAEAARARGAVAEARMAATEATAALDDAHRRHWGRRDRDAIEAAARRSEQAEARLSAAIDHESSSRRVVKAGGRGAARPRPGPAGQPRRPWPSSSRRSPTSTACWTASGPTA